MQLWPRCLCDNVIPVCPRNYGSGGIFYFVVAYHPVKGERGMKTKVTGRALPMMIGVSVGVAVGLLVTVICASVIATLILSGRISEVSIGYCGYVVVSLSVVLGGSLASWMVKRRKLLVCALVAAIYYCALFCVASLFFGGVHRGGILTAVITLVAAFSIGLVGPRSRGAGRFDGRKYHPR